VLQRSSARAYIGQVEAGLLVAEGDVDGAVEDRLRFFGWDALLGRDHADVGGVLLGLGPVFGAHVRARP
jgi:hypothetical protein